MFTFDCIDFSDAVETVTVTTSEIDISNYKSFEITLITSNSIPAAYRTSTSADSSATLSNISVY